MLLLSIIAARFSLEFLFALFILLINNIHSNK